MKTAVFLSCLFMASTSILSIACSPNEDNENNPEIIENENNNDSDSEDNSGSEENILQPFYNFLYKNLYYQKRPGNNKNVWISGATDDNENIGKYEGGIYMRPTVPYNNINYNVTGICNGAFTYNKKITDIHFTSIDTIEHGAFLDCEKLEIISFPISLKYIGFSAFHGTKWFNKQPNGLIYIHNFLYSYKGTMSANTEISIKEGTTHIVGYAFRIQTNMKKITFPNTLKAIGNSAFISCTALEKIELPASMTTIEERAFHNCTQLKSINIPANVNYIGPSAFYNCVALEEIHCSSVEPITLYYSYEPVFGKVDHSTCVLYVPKGSINKYKNADYWKEFQIIKEE